MYTTLSILCFSFAIALIAPDILLPALWLYALTLSFVMPEMQQIVVALGIITPLSWLLTLILPIGGYSFFRSAMQRYHSSTS